jgi:hypothetical protein
MFAFPRPQQGGRGTDEDEDEEEGRRWRCVIPVQRDAWVVGGLVRGKLNGAFFLLSTGSILQFPRLAAGWRRVLQAGRSSRRKEQGAGRSFFKLTPLFQMLPSPETTAQGSNPVPSRPTAGSKR